MTGSRSNVVTVYHVAVLVLALVASTVAWAAVEEEVFLQNHRRLSLQYNHDAAQYELVSADWSPRARLRGGARSVAAVPDWVASPDGSLQGSVGPVDIEEALLPSDPATYSDGVHGNQWLEWFEVDEDGTPSSLRWLPWEHVVAVQNSTVVLWPPTSKGEAAVYEIPYEVKKNAFSDWVVKNILQWSMRNIERGSNIRFRPVRTGDPNWIWFESGELCLSRIGRRPDAGPQRIMLNPKTCLYRHAVQHEILHCLGFFHEHQRIDHKRFVAVVPETPSDVKSQLLADSRVPVADKPYDLASIMHYHNFLQATDPRHQSIIETRSPTLSSCDWNLLNTLYPGETKPLPCVPHQHIRACEPLETCPFSSQKCAALCDIDCDAGLSRGDIADQYKPPADPPYCRYLGGQKFPPLPSASLAGSERLPLSSGTTSAANESYFHSESESAAAVEPAKSIYNVVWPSSGAARVMAANSEG